MIVNYDTAKDMAMKELEKLETKSGISLALLESATVEFEYGWVFCYQSQEYVNTGNTESLVGGNAPFIIDKFTAEIVITGTGKPMEVYLDEYIIKKRTARQ